MRLTPAQLTYRGTHGTLPTAYLDLASDTIKPGMSGAAVLNLRSGAVCGVVVASKHPSRPDGALAIPWSAIAADLAAVLDANSVFHATDKRWEEAAAAGGSGGRGPGGRSRLATAGRARGDQRAGDAGGGPAGVRAAGCRCCRVRCPGRGGGRGAAGRVRAAGRRVLGGEDPVRGGGGEGAAARVVAGASGRACRGRRTGAGACTADGGVADAAAALPGRRARAFRRGGAGAAGRPGPGADHRHAWPDRYYAYTAVPAPGGPDPHAREREVLELAAVIRIGAEFSPAEQDRARAAAARDRRLALALAAAGYGLTQTLAAAPQLVARWEEAQDANPYAWAVLTAALDVARLGARAPLPADLLRAAASGYCTSAQQAEAPGNWFERALAYATEKLHGAAAALSPAGTGVMGQVAGYAVADYLLQHASRERRPARVPASTWDALLRHVGDPADAARLAGSAEGTAAVPLRHLALPARRRHRRQDRRRAARPDLLVERGDLEELRARANAERQVRRPAGRPAGRPRGPGRAARPRQRRRSCRRHGTGRLLAGRGDLDELRARADAGDRIAAERLADRGELDGAEQLPRARTDARRRRSPPWGWTSCAPAPTPATVRRPAAGQGAGRARGPGRGRAAPARLGRGRRQGGRRVARSLLAERGNLDGAEQLLCAQVEADDWFGCPGGWPSCWPSAGTWTSCARAPTPATCTPPSGWPAGRARGPGRGRAAPARPRRRRERRAAGRAADAAGPGRRSGAIAAVRPEPGRVNRPRVKDVTSRAHTSAAREARLCPHPAHQR